MHIHTFSPHPISLSPPPHLSFNSFLLLTLFPDAQTETPEEKFWAAGPGLQEGSLCLSAVLALLAGPLLVYWLPQASMPQSQNFKPLQGGGGGARDWAAQEGEPRA